MRLTSKRHCRRPARAIASALLIGMSAVGCVSGRETEDEAEIRRLNREIMTFDSERSEERMPDPQPLGERWPKFCSAHGTRLGEDVVPILYGLAAEVVEPRLRDARLSQFPNAAAHYPGGCCVIRGLPK